MTVAVIIPAGGELDSSRTRSLGMVASLYAEFFPDWEVIVGRNDGLFNRARAINDAVAETDADVIVFNDADSLVEPAHISRMVHDAHAPGLVFGYTRYRRLNRRATEGLSSYIMAFTQPDQFFDWEMLNAGSNGCAAIRRECFEQVGGLDEKFEGWGYEDLAFDVICEAHWPSRRVAGDLVHLWHPTAENTHPELTKANEARYLNEYVPLFGDREALLDLVAA